MFESPATQRRPGGRSARVQEAVETAALQQLLDVGLASMTIRGVAQAAGVAETTVYRRWPTTSHLAAAALLRLAELDNPIPDTGSLSGDLRALLQQIVDLLRRPEVLRVVRSSAALGDDRDGSVAAAKSAFFDRRFTNSAPVVERAIARGELPPETDAYRLVETLVAPAYMRALLGSKTIDGALIESSVAVTLAAFS